LRIKLVCTLLDSCADAFVTLSNYSKLDKFLAALQRYMFTKLTLPTDIEFSILDTFDLLESKLKSLEKDKKNLLTITHYETWLEAHNVTVPFEELEASAGEKIHRRLLTQAGISNVFHVDDDPDDHTMPFDDDGDDSVDDQVSLNTNDDDSVDGSENSSLDSYQSDEDATDEEDEESDIESDDEEDGDEDLSEEEIDEAAAHEAYMRKLEDEAFDHQLRRLTIDAIEKGKNTARTSASTKVSDTMPSASQFSRKKPSGSGINEDETQPGKISNFALGGSNGVSFKMLKRGHKGRVEEMSLVVPSETNLAKNVSKQDDEAARERDMLKERVLRYEAESAEQMYSDVYLDQARLPEVRNRPLLMEDIDRNFGGSNYRNRTHSSSSRGRGGRGGGRLFDARRGHYGS
jgi:regulator of nonsense transcripts 2